MIPVDMALLDRYDALEVACFDLPVNNIGGRNTHLQASIDEALSANSGVEELPEVIKKYRELYWCLGMDPTKRRVCTESLFKMTSAGRFPTVNPVVDAVNLASLISLVPMSAFDTYGIEGQIELRPATRMDTFRPIGSKVQPIVEGWPVLADAEKVIMVGYASSDSDTTKVTHGTKNVRVVAYGIRGHVSARVPLEKVWELLSNYCNVGAST